MKKIMLSLGIVSILFTGCYETGRGEKIGQVVKINEASGFLCKTVEVEIVRGGFNSGSGVNGQSLHFTVENNPGMVNTLKQAMLDGSEVVVTFSKEFVSICRSDSTNNFGTSVKILNTPKTNGNTQQNTTSVSQDDKTSALIKTIINQNEALIKILGDK